MQTINSIWLPQFPDKVISNSNLIPSTIQTSSNDQTLPSSSAATLADYASLTGYKGASTHDQISTKATRRISAYLRWYKDFIKSYQHDLDEAGEKDWGYINYALDEGVPILQNLGGTLHIKTQSQINALIQVLRGFQRLARYTTDLEGRGVLLSRLVTDVIDQLSELGILSQSREAQVVITTVAHTQSKSPRTSQVAAYQSLSISKPPSHALRAYEWGGAGGIGCWYFLYYKK